MYTYNTEDKRQVNQSDKEDYNDSTVEPDNIPHLPRFYGNTDVGSLDSYFIFYINLSA